MMPKVSVIIPIYNSEATIRRCIDSVINQSLKEIEIILVDDGSTDNCAEICDFYADKDSRVKVIHKGNEGCSAARNDGIRVSNGEYLGFVDADDYIEFNMYSEMYKLAKNFNFDVVEVGFNRVFDKEELVTLPLAELSAPNVTNKIIRMSLVNGHNILFPISSHMGEDLAFSSKVDLISTSRGILNFAPYNYILCEDSVSYNLEKRFDIYDSIDDILDFEKGLSKKNNLDISGLIYRHGFELPLFNIEKNQNREEYIKTLLEKVLKYKSHLNIKHKFLISKKLLYKHIEFNYRAQYYMVRLFLKIIKKLSIFTKVK